MEGREGVAVIVKVGGHNVSVLYDEKKNRFTFEVTFSNGRKDAVSLAAAKKRPREEEEELQPMAIEPKSKRAREEKVVEEGQKEVTMSMLPNEIIQAILGEVSKDKVMRVVCRSVCRVWRELTISPPLNHSPLRPCRSFAHHTILKGWVSILHWAIEHGCIWDSSAFVAAAKLGSVELLKLIRTQKYSEQWYQKDKKVESLTGETLRVDVLEWLLSDGCPLNMQLVANTAAEEANLSLLEWVQKRKYPISVVDFHVVFEFAASVGCLPSMKWLKESDEVGLIDLTVEVFVMIVQSKNIEAVKWARANRCPWDESVFAEALVIGDMGIIDWLYENGCPCRGPETSAAFYRLASLRSSKGLTVLKWAKENDFKWVTRKMSKIATNFEVVKWLKEAGDGEWHTGSVVKKAAETGSIEDIKWAIENGCPVSNTALFEAIKKGDLEMAKYLTEQGCNVRLKGICGQAALTGNLEMVQWLREHGCRWGDTARNAALGGYLPILKWAIASGCPFTSKDFEGSIIVWKHFDMIKWLITKNIIKCDAEMWKQLVCNGSVETLDWLSERGMQPSPIIHEEFTAWAAESNQLRVLNWCKEKGIKWTNKTLLAAFDAWTPAALRFILNSQGVTEMLIEPWLEYKTKIF